MTGRTGTSRRTRRTRRTRTAVALVAAGVFAVVGGACSDDGGGGGSQPSDSATKADTRSGRTITAHSGNLGTILAGGGGRVVYLFKKDKTTESTCSGACADAWPPVVVKGKPIAGRGVRSGMLGTTKRGDGRRQTTYNGHPLYYYSGDDKAGQTNGQGLDQFGAKWYVLDPSGNEITKKPSGGGGGGY